uniref:DUF4136 domain-containing protein n=1 Tax=Thaumasiovibrio occultus TaxID=1891184 RepID=UPI000B357F4A|nr:DUF4136 domain-containing protein [Thaumasiovibrio occultus]
MWKTLLMSLLLVGCSAAPTIDYSATTNFADLNTYQFADSDSPASLDGERIEAAIATQMTLKGFTRVEEQGDVIVHYAIREERELQSYGTTIGFGYYSRGFGVGFSAPERLREIRYGNLVVDMVDVGSDKVIWQAVSNSRLTESMGPDKRNTFFNEQVAKMFAQYPPVQ